MLRLPKDTNDANEILQSHFTAGESPIREGSTVVVSRWPLAAPLKAALQATARVGHLVQGLEQIGETLDRELKGLRALAAKTGAPQKPRLSRLLLLSNDGADRFLRQAESLLERHGERTHGVVIDVSAEDLGQMFTPKGTPAKAFLIDDRKALTLFLTTLAANLATS